MIDVPEVRGEGKKSDEQSGVLFLLFVVFVVQQLTEKLKVLKKSEFGEVIKSFWETRPFKEMIWRMSKGG